MKRDMELIRRLVLKLEDAPTGYAPDDFNVDGEYTPEQIGYHAYLMIQAGLATGSDITSMNSGSPIGAVTGLTWAGHEFADAAGDEKRWRHANGDGSGERRLCHTGGANRTSYHAG
jgi:hypothetical protein